MNSRNSTNSMNCGVDWLTAVGVVLLVFSAVYIIWARKK
jgi:hypothetical protein